MQRLAPLLVDCLAFARVERGQIVVEIAVAVIGPMELLSDALQKPGLGEGVSVDLVGEMYDLRRQRNRDNILSHSSSENA